MTANPTTNHSNFSQLQLQKKNTSYDKDSKSVHGCEITSITLSNIFFDYALLQNITNELKEFELDSMQDITVWIYALQYVIFPEYI